MPSAAGKRVGRVLAGCSKPEAGDKPGLPTWQGILGASRYPCIDQQEILDGYVPCNRHVSCSDTDTVTTSHGNHPFPEYERFTRVLERICGIGQKGSENSEFRSNQVEFRCT